jgi:hypothetical protein
MKYLQIFLTLTFIILSCSTSSLLAQNKTSYNYGSKPQKSNTIRITDNKKLNFSFIDNGFSNWLKRQKPQQHFYQSSLEIINLQYVNEWNKRVDNASFNSELYTQQINYQLRSKTHYGMDVNYKLFMYFKYFEEKHEIILKRF